MAAWVGVTTLGWVAGMMPMVLGINHIWDANRTDLFLTEEEIATFIYYCLVLLITSLIGGTVIGFGQQMILRSYLGSQMWQWLTGTMLGSIVGWSVGLFVSTWPLALLPKNTPIAWLVQGVIVTTVAGLSIAISQSRVLRPWVAANNQWTLETNNHPLMGGAVYWVLYTMMAWAVGGVVFWLMYILLRPAMLVHPEPWPIYQAEYLSEYGPAVLAGWLVGGLVVGTITGFAMKRLLKGATAAHYQPLTPNP